MQLVDGIPNEDLCDLLRVLYRTHRDEMKMNEVEGRLDGHSRANLCDQLPHMMSQFSCIDSRTYNLSSALNAVENVYRHTENVRLDHISDISILRGEINEVKHDMEKLKDGLSKLQKVIEMHLECSEEDSSEDEK